MTNSLKGYKPNLKELIHAIKKLDKIVSFNKKEQTLYHQSRFWLFRHLQQNAIGNIQTSPEKLPGLTKGFLFFIISVVRILFARVKGQRPVMLVEHLRLRGYQWNHGDPYFGLTELDLVEKGNALIIIGLHEHYSLGEVMRGPKIIIPRVIFNGLRFVFNKSLFLRKIEIASTIKKELSFLGVEQYFKPEQYTKRLKQIDADNLFSKLLIKFINPKYLLCVDGYNSNSSLILATYDKIPSFEYQHGIISSSHIGYSFGKGYKLPEGVLPSHFISWGKKWTQKLDPLFVKNTNCQIGTYEYGLWSRESVSSPSPAKGVLFIMQPSAASFIENQIRIFRDLYPEETIGIRYHPKHPDKIEGLDNCEHNFEGNLYELFMRYEYIIGCFSTSLFEAVALDKKVFFIYEPGLDVYEEVLMEAGINPIESVKDIYNTNGSSLKPESFDIISKNENSKIISDIVD